LSICIYRILLGPSLRGKPQHCSYYMPGWCCCCYRKRKRCHDWWRRQAWARGL